MRVSVSFQGVCFKAQRSFMYNPGHSDSQCTATVRRLLLDKFTQSRAPSNAFSSDMPLFPASSPCRLSGVFNLATVDFGSDTDVNGVHEVRIARVNRKS